MKLKTVFAITVIASNIPSVTNAGDVDLSNVTITPLNENTIQVYGAQYALTPGVEYNVNFSLNEETLSFELNQLEILEQAKYTEADLVRGGLLYDKWWKINNANEPTENHPRYPSEGSNTGSTTWRCKECHGWDYKGNEGAYESGSHYTGIKPVYDMKRQSTAYIYGAIVDHDIPSLSEQDIWDLTKFLKEGLVDMNKYIIFTGTQSKSATGDVENGRILYEGTGKCSNCHGEDGNQITELSVGAVANDNPWETLHKIRFGNPGSKMPSMISTELSLEEQIDILTYTQTLPQLETEEH
jgi:mono/diheme cytochrome c family protein